LYQSTPAILKRWLATRKGMRIIREGSDNFFWPKEFKDSPRNCSLKKKGRQKMKSEKQLSVLSNINLVSSLFRWYQSRLRLSAQGH